jgi:hypothetical protein
MRQDIGDSPAFHPFAWDSGRWWGSVKAVRIRFESRWTGWAAVAALLAMGVPAAANPPLLVSRAPQADLPGLRLRPDTAAPAVPLDLSRFSFTAPREPAARTRPGGVERSFSFTPSGNPGRKSVTIGASSRTLNGSADAVTTALRPVVAAGLDPATQPTGYAVDLAVGWRGFALSGGMSRLSAPDALGPREELDVGLSYGGRRWRTGIIAAAERTNPLLGAPADPDPDRYSLAATGAVAVSKGLSISGGIRYRTAPLNPTLLDPNKPDEAVYVGGKLAF